jgi:hypothetical protein
VSEYYKRLAELEPYTTARSDDVRNEFDAIQSAFELLATPRRDGTVGFLTPFTVVNPVEPNHPATHAQVTTEHEKNDEQDARLDNTENLIAGMGPLDARFTTLRYVAVAGQTSIVLPGQFQSLAYVHKNGGKLYQTVGFNYDVETKTITFTDPLALNDEVLVDVGVVPDAVLADLLSIQNDIASKHSDVSSKHDAVAQKHGDIENWHPEVQAKHQEVVGIAGDFGDLNQLKNSIDNSEQNVISLAGQALDNKNTAVQKASEASTSAINAKSSETKTKASENNVAGLESSVAANTQAVTEMKVSVDASEQVVTEKAANVEAIEGRMEIIAESSSQIRMGTNMINTQALMTKIKPMH